MSNSCQHLSEFMKTQVEIMKKHLDEHKYLRHIEDKEEAMASFITDYGWLMREMYCTKICNKKSECDIADKLHKEGDLLKHRIKEK